MVVDAGSRDELAGREDGVCHLFEATAFRGTEKRSHKEVVSALDDLGAIPTANSSREQMLLSIDVLRNSLPEALEIFGDAVLNPKIGGSRHGSRGHWSYDGRGQEFMFKETYAA